jgi:hypothetical protein
VFSRTWACRERAARDRGSEGETELSTALQAKIDELKAKSLQLAAADLKRAPVKDTRSKGAKGPRPPKNAGGRILELLAEVKKLKQELVEARQVLACPDPVTEEVRREREKLRMDMMDVLAENAELKSREEQRLLAAEEDAKNARQVAEDHRLLCFRALVDVAHQTGAYQRHPDFDTRLRRTQQSFSTPLLESILCFPPAIAPELAYAIASEDAAAAKLSALSLSAQLFCLIKMNGEFEERIKFSNLSNLR